MSKKDLRDNLLAKTPEFKKEFETINGKKYEIRQPSVAGREQIMDSCRFDLSQVDENDSEEEAKKKVAQNIKTTDMRIWSMIYMVYVPGTDERVFDPEDYEMLKKQPTGSFVDTLSSTCMKLLNKKPEEDAKN